MKEDIWDKINRQFSGPCGQFFIGWIVRPIMLLVMVPVFIWAAIFDPDSLKH